MARFHLKLMRAQSADETTAVVGPARPSQVQETTFYVTFSPGTTAGVVEIEASPDAAFTGTWASISTVNWAAANRTHFVSTTGVHLAMRARISTAIVGGTIDVDVVGQ